VIHEIEEGRIYEDDYFVVEAAHLDHRIECFGYRVIEKDLPGRLNVEKLRQLGLPEGPLYGQLKLGLDVQLSDGRIISGQEMMGPPIRGRVVTILGDTLYCENAIHLADQADVVVHEATFSQDKSDLAEQFSHATTVQAAMVASQAQAKMLIMNRSEERRVGK